MSRLIVIIVMMWHEGCTCECCKILGKLVVRGERLIKLSDSWFSAKSMDVERCLLHFVVKLTYVDIGD